MFVSVPAHAKWRCYKAPIYFIKNFISTNFQGAHDMVLNLSAVKKDKSAKTWAPENVNA